MLHFVLCVLKYCKQFNHILFVLLGLNEKNLAVSHLISINFSFSAPLDSTDLYSPMNEVNEGRTNAAELNYGSLKGTSINGVKQHL